MEMVDRFSAVKIYCCDEAATTVLSRDRDVPVLIPDALSIS